MDTLIGLFVLAAAVAVFIGMVRRTKAKAHELEREMESKVWLSDRPKLLTKKQREAANSTERQPQRKKSSPEALPVEPRPARKLTRAIRNGWSLGHVEFSYEDTAGDITFRNVTVHSITRTYLKGECHGRQAERTFRLDRIVGGIVDCETGEMMSPSEWAKQKAK
jgi:predicted DNA-binding transcriptional regulator YafY